MKKILSKLTIFNHRFSKLTLFLGLVIVNLVLIFLFATVFYFLSGKISYGEAIKDCFRLSVSSDGVYDTDLTTIVFVMKMIFAVVEMTLFTGAIIGFTTNILSNRFDEAENAKGKLNLTDHLVFLNWSAIVPDIIHDLHYMEGRHTVVILCDKDKDEVIKAIESVFLRHHEKNNNVDIIFRHGSPFSAKDLEDIALSRASAVSILSPKTNTKALDDDFLTINDLKALKLLLTVSQTVSKDCNIVLEVETKEAVAKLKNLVSVVPVLKDKKVSIFSFASVLGYLMGKILINPIYHLFYDEVLSFQGVEFYSTDSMNIKEYLSIHNNSLPIINYDNDQSGNLDELYVLADEKSDITNPKFIRKKAYNSTKKLTIKDYMDRSSMTIFIVGNSNKVRYIKENLFLFKKNNPDSQIEFKIFPSGEILEICEELAQKEGIKKLLLLSNDRLSSSETDANIYIELLGINNAYEKFKDIEIFTEILDPANYNSVNNFNVSGVVVSNKFISLLIIQLITHFNASSFFEDLMLEDSVEGGCFDVKILKASEVLDFSEKQVFTSKSQLVSSFYHSSNEKAMLIGLYNEGEESIEFLNKNMDEPCRIEVKKDTNLVLILY